MTRDDGPVARYLDLGLRLGRHVDGLVDAYYGPPERAARVAAEPLRSPDALAADAKRLLADLAPASDGAGELDGERRRWIARQVGGLHTTARKLAGEYIPYEDEVAACYGVRPKLVSEDELVAAHRTLDGVLPGSGPVRDRLIAWREAHAVPVDRLGDAVSSLVEDFRDRTARLFGLPDGERVDFELVNDKPWGGFNYYLGGLRSRVAVNTDLPVLSSKLPHLVAHESYPGHHTEHCRKEVGLVRRRRHLEETIFLVGTPQCLVAEGLADLGLEVILGRRPEPVIAEHFAALGVRYDGDLIAQVAEADEVLAAVRGNAALLLHGEGRDPEEVVAYLERWALLPRPRAEKALQFLSDPTWRAYISCYVEGLPLCRRFVGGDPSRFERLITEALTPDDLANAA